MKVPFLDLQQQYRQIEGELMPRLQKVMADGTFVLGNEVREFEENLVKYCGCKYAVGVANGTDAIILALKALGIQSEDEVITAANTFVPQRKPLNMRARSRSWRIVTRSPTRLTPSLLKRLSVRVPER